MSTVSCVNTSFMTIVDSLVAWVGAQSTAPKSRGHKASNTRPLNLPCHPGQAILDLRVTYVKN